MYNTLRKKTSASWFHSSPDATLSDLKTVGFSTRNDPLHEMWVKYMDSFQELYDQVIKTRPVRKQIQWTTIAPEFNLGPKHVLKKQQNKTPERPLGNKKNILFRFSNIFFPVSQGPKEPERINANKF